MNQIPLRVVKVGGSLLDWPDVGAALQRWLAARPVGQNLLVAGGGKLADYIRESDERFDLSPRVSHDLCLETLRVSARLLAALLPNSQLLTSLDEARLYLETASTDATAIFCPYQFMIEWEPQNHSRPLPASWDVTSDSIAARIAEVLSADELVLLKSSDPPAKDPAIAGYVDAHFAATSKNLHSVRFVNLRNHV